MDIIERAKYALCSFMCANPQRLPTSPETCRSYFTIEPFPVPRAIHHQWDEGDETSRALDAWYYLRNITHDYSTGADIERGQWEYLKSLITADTGLVCVPENSLPSENKYYCHLWDQARALRHLINRYINIERTDELYNMIRRLLDSTVALAKEITVDGGRRALYWEYDVYYGGKPAIGMDFGIYNFTNFTVGCAQLLEPTVKWASVTGDDEYLRLSEKLAAGFIMGLEHRRESESPMFDRYGGFKGHFHCGASGLCGLVGLAKLLYTKGETDAATEYLELSRKAYRRIFSEDNAGRGSTMGWFPENSGAKPAQVSEICCTADMIELAASLASVSCLIPGYESLDELWDDAERFAVNELFAMQILNPDRFAEYLAPGEAENFNRVKELYRGGWPFGHNLAYDLMKYSENTPYEKLKYDMTVGGCCLYSGPRGLYAYYRSMVCESEAYTDIRFPGSFAGNNIEMKAAQGGGFEFTALKDSTVAVRLPGYIYPESIKILYGGGEAGAKYDGSANRYIIAASAGTSYSVVWQDKNWSSRETFGMNGKNGERITYHLDYHGSRLSGISPCGEPVIDYLGGL